MKLELKKTICALSQVDFTKPERAEEKITEAVNSSEANLEMIKDINSNAQMLLQIFSTSLQISNMELGKLNLNYTPFNVVEMVDSLVSVFSTIAKEKGLILQSFFDFENVPVIVKGDHIRLSQVLVNFVSNSVKYTKKGKVYLDVSMIKSTDKDFPFNDQAIEIDLGKEIISGNQLEYIKIVCQDTGIGIPKEELGKLCKPSHTIHHTEGSGLNNVEYEKVYRHLMGGQNSFNDRHGIGLSLSLNFIHLMKGKLNIESELDKGTTLTLYIPVIKCSPDECSKVHNTIFSKISCLKQLGSSAISRIVILEDDPEYLSILTKLCNQILKPPTISHIEKHNVVESLTDITANTLILYNHKDYKDVIERFSGKLISNKIIPIFRRGEKIPTKAKPIVLPSRVESIIKTIYHCLSNTTKKLLSPSSATSTMDIDKAFALPHNNRILVVDDNAINRKLLKKALNMLGYSADMASDGSEALDLIKKQPNSYDIIFMDLLMPNMGGKDSCKFMREWGCRSQIIAVTANIWASSQSLTQNGFSSVLRKPFTIDDIKQVLKHE
ncbi:predicted protein [Naegleria gruberi]|uniref:Predicted protein n=1 Tax=Naegleria gruberi TaxID=5762 RepID=D2W0J5_NAEGR|nr:uncharacterized protein NAEGRDRAFT_74882 [Naegleria gruberi]EFC37440.1 predicted protein [Naegleria gruberi]|eukprot:XP_002670184.1 predicted protein [Naegleria gruberi strain NEG-M]